MIILTFYKVFYNRFSKDPTTANMLSYASIDLVIFLLIQIPIQMIFIFKGYHYHFLPSKGIIWGTFFLTIFATKYLMEKIYKTNELPRGIDNKFQVSSAESRMVWYSFIFCFVASMGMAIVRKYLETGN